MRKVIYFVACSVDGFIARADGSAEGWLLEGEHMAAQVADYPETLPTHLHSVLGVNGGNRQFDTVLMGRKTYEVGLSQGITSPYSHLKQYVVSRTFRSSPDANVTLVSDHVTDAVRALKQQPGQDIWLCGGGELATLLLKDDLLDDLILKRHPVLFGAGIPLFADGVPLTRMQLAGSKVYSSGVEFIHYRVNGSTQ